MRTSARYAISSRPSAAPAGFLVPNPQDPANKHRKPENPMFDLIPHRKGGQNQVPSFITQYGPIREVRFQRKPDGTPDGGVHALFTVVGRSDIGGPGCTAAVLPPTDFETQYQNGNLSFRIPLQTFGLGLIEAIQDLTILNNSASTASLRTPLGIGGMPNRSGNDGTIARFGWKAQNKSLAIFAGEAYNVEMGVTNDVFPTARDETPACSQGINEPNDITRTDTNDLRNQGFNNPLHMIADWLEFAIFMRRTGAAATGAVLGQRRARAATLWHGQQQSWHRLFSLPHADDDDRAPARNRSTPEPGSPPVFGPVDSPHGQRFGGQRDAGPRERVTCSERRRFGASVRGCSSCTTAGPVICWQLSLPTLPATMIRVSMAAGRTTPPRIIRRRKRML